jgi:hypothetical protein
LRPPHQGSSTGPLCKHGSESSAHSSSDAKVSPETMVIPFRRVAVLHGLGRHLGDINRCDCDRSRAKMRKMKAAKG